MKTLKEHISEALADRNGVPRQFNKNLHAKMVTHARHHIQAVADDIEQGVQDAIRTMGRHNAGSVYSGVEDHLADHLHDTFRNHPGYGEGGFEKGKNWVSLARHVSSQVTKEYIHDDRPEYKAAVRNQGRKDSSRAKRMVQDQQDSEDKNRIQLTSTDSLIKNREHKIDLAKRAKESGDTEWYSELRKHVKWHNDELALRGVTPPKPVKPKSTVYDYTKRGLVARKLPPFQKA